MSNPPPGALIAYLAMLTSGESHALLEVRYTRPRGMGRRFFSAQDHDRAARFIQQNTEHADVYVGVAPRTRRAGGKAAIKRCHVIWADIDRDDASERLARLMLPPTLAIATGTPGHLHAYWHLTHPLAGHDIQQLNQRIARALDADRHCTDIARVLRPPHTHSHKRTPPASVDLLTHTAARYSAEEISAAVPQLPGAQRRPVARTARSTDRPQSTSDLREIPTRQYIAALAGLTPDHSGKVHCPFHDDSTPSLHVYTHDWYCYGCRRGGSIYDFAATLWHIQPRGRQFLALHDRLATELDHAPVTSPAGQRERHDAPLAADRSGGRHRGTDGQITTARATVADIGIDL